MNNRITDYSGHGIVFQGTNCVKVDFTDSSTYSSSASDTAGYYDVAEELGVDWAYMHLNTGGNMTVVFLNDDPDTGEVLFPFQAGTTEHKIKRIYYNQDNDYDKFYLVYTKKED
jgi:hypothetical protein